MTPEQEMKALIDCGSAVDGTEFREYMKVLERVKEIALRQIPWGVAHLLRFLLTSFNILPKLRPSEA